MSEQPVVPVVGGEQQSAELTPPVAGTSEGAPPASAQEGQQPAADAKPVGEADDIKKSLRGVQRRINELTREKHEALERGRQESDELRQRVAQYEQHFRTLQQQTSEPVYDGTNGEEYLRKVATREAQAASQAVLEQEREAQREAAQSHQQRQHQAAVKHAIAQTVDRLVQNGEKKFPGFGERITSDELPPIVGTAAFDAIMDSGERAPDILNYLAINPVKAHEIAALSPIAQAKEVGRIEAAIASGRLVSNAPPPPQAIGSGGGSAPKDPSQMNYDEFVRFRRKQIAARR